MQLSSYKAMPRAIQTVSWCIYRTVSIKHPLCSLQTWPNDPEFCLKWQCLQAQCLLNRSLGHIQSNLYITALYIAITLIIRSPDNLPKIFNCLIFLQSCPAFSGHPVYNSLLAISQGWPLYTGLTVFIFSFFIFYL